MMSGLGKDTVVDGRVGCGAYAVPAVACLLDAMHQCSC